MSSLQASPGRGQNRPWARNTGHLFFRYPAALTPFLIASLLSAAPASPAVAASPARNSVLGASAPATPFDASPAALEAPEVGVPFGCGLAFPVSQGHNVGSHLNYD